MADTDKNCYIIDGFKLAIMHQTDSPGLTCGSKLLLDKHSAPAVDYCPL